MTTKAHTAAKPAMVSPPGRCVSLFGGHGPQTPPEPRPYGEPHLRAVLKIQGETPLAQLIEEAAVRLERFFADAMARGD